MGKVKTNDPYQSAGVSQTFPTLKKIIPERTRMSSWKELRGYCWMPRGSERIPVPSHELRKNLAASATHINSNVSTQNEEHLTLCQVRGFSFAKDRAATPNREPRKWNTNEGKRHESLSFGLFLLWFSKISAALFFFFFGPHDSFLKTQFNNWTFGSFMVYTAFLCWQTCTQPTETYQH